MWQKDQDPGKAGCATQTLLRRDARLLFRFFAGWLMLFPLLQPAAWAETPADTTQKAPAEQTWKVNLKEADIRAFVTQVADITGYSFVVDPRVKGKVTVLSSASMNKAEIYDLFLGVLQVHGFTAIPGEEVIKVIQQVDAKQTAEVLGRFGQHIPSEQLVTRVIPINNASALELVPILRPMVAKYGHLAGVAAANALIISDHVANVERMERIIKELDSPSKYELEVIQLKQAWVGDTVKLLKELAPTELGATPNSAPTGKFSVVADERSNRLIVRGDQNFRLKMRELVAKLDQTTVSEGTTKVIRLAHADAKTLAELLKGVMGEVVKEKTQGQGAASGQSQPQEEVAIFADEGLNALVVRAKPALMKEVELIIKQLDIRRAQVMIEAAIVEINDELSRDLGVQFAVADQSKKGTVPLLGTSFNNVGLSAASIIGALGGGDNAGGLAPATGVTVGIGEQDKDGISWAVLLQALSNSTAANLLSTPSIITLDNEESEIVVGQNVPFRTGETTNTSAGLSNPFTTIERRDVGLTLKVTPSISEDDLVRLVVEQTTESVTESIADASDIVTNKREIKTTVLADNGETIVLGGLISDDVTSQVSKVPLLGDIPILGRLFSSESKLRTKRNLLVFLRPTIMREKGQAIDVTQKKFDTLWEVNLGLHEKLGEDVTGAIKPSIGSLLDGNNLTPNVRADDSKE